jgi:AraC family transcriptional regulator
MVARHLRHSPAHLGGILRRTTGRSFRTLLSETRVRRAQDLLRDPTLSVKEVAVAIGFSSVSEMDRHVRRRLRTTPSAFRESLG